MKTIEKLNSFWESNRKVLTIVIASALAVLFAGSILLAVFVGGEFKPAEVEQTVKGRLIINEATYRTSYISGESFVFNKEDAKIRLMAKDPDKTEIVKIDEMEESDYGFLVNGEGELYADADSVIMDTNMEFISVASREYPSLTCDIPVKVRSGSSINFTDSLTLEAEDAYIYRLQKGGYELIAEEDKSKLPSADKPFLSSAGEDAKTGNDIKDLSGGACVRSLGDLDVKIEFEIACTEETEANLEILICKRPQAKNFGDSFGLYLNGKAITEFDKVSVPARSTGEPDYFTSYALTAISIKLAKGVNVITFENKKNNPGNLDAVRVTADSVSIGAFGA